jgi:hypothetical protein
MAKPKRRVATFRYKPEVWLGTAPIVVWGYGRSGKFACRLEVNSAGLAVYSGPRGGKKLIDASWEKLTKRLGSAVKDN